MHPDAPTFTTTLVDNCVPLSPRQWPVEEDSHRSSFSGPARRHIRHPAPPEPQAPGRHLAAPGMSVSSSSNSLYPQWDYQQPIPQPLSNLQSQLPPGDMFRRHTTDDIRQHGWQVNSPFSELGTPHRPPSPGKPPNGYRDASLYDMPWAPGPSIFMPQTSPPWNEGGGSNHDGRGGGIAGSFGGSKLPHPQQAGHAAPPARRSSLASSSVHALLNPPDSAVERDHVNDGGPDDRKRKRMM